MWIQTTTGRKVYPLEMKAEDVVIEDIANSLAQTARFRGHARSFYSVAQHSLEVAQRLPVSVAAQGLLHDAAEAYLFDAVRPLKHVIYFSGKVNQDNVPFSAMEEHVLRTIFDALCVPWPSEQIWKLIHSVDDAMLMTEKRDLLAPEPEPWACGAEPYPEPLYPMEWETAKDKFLMAWRELADKPGWRLSLIGAIR